jgi:hypothetical protein
MTETSIQLKFVVIPNQAKGIAKIVGKLLIGQWKLSILSELKKFRYWQFQKNNIYCPDDKSYALV